MSNKYFKPGPGIATLLTWLLACLPGAALANNLMHYNITIDNITGKPFTPHLAVTHEGDLNMLMKTASASAEPEAIAAGGHQMRILDRISSDRLVTEAIDTGAPLAPKEATTFRITAQPGNRLSLTTASICENNSFAGLNRAHLPKRGAEILWTAGALDSAAMSADIGGPCTSFTPGSLSDKPNRDENPAAKITITRVSDNASEFLARLSGAGTVPPIQGRNRAWGQADLTLDSDNTALDYRLKALRIKSGVIQVRIHHGLPNDNGPVVAYLFEPADSGIDQHLNTRGRLTRSDLVGPLAGDFEGFVDALRAGELYINIDSKAFPQGEIRGQVGVK